MSHKASSRSIVQRASALATMLAVLAAASSGRLAAGTASLAEAQPYRGIVKPVHQAAFSSDLVTPVAAIHFREGERFKQGELLVELDCARHRHDLEALASQVREMRVAVVANEHLVKSGAANRNDVGTARARLDRAIAEQASMEQRLRQCRIVAPFEGVVTELTIHPHETPAVNQPFITIASHTALEIEIIVPSRMVMDLTPSSALRFSIDETRRVYEARIRRTGGAVDPVSQTIKIYAAFVAGDDAVLPGMSGTASFAAAGDTPR